MSHEELLNFDITSLFQKNLEQKDDNLIEATSHLEVDELEKKANENNIILDKQNTNSKPNKLVQAIVTEQNARFLLHGRYLNLRELKQKLPELSQLSAKGLKANLDSASKTLVKRGLPPLKSQVKNVRTLDPEFVAAVNYLMSTTDKRSVTAKLKDLGISSQKFDRFLNRQDHLDFYKQAIDKQMSGPVWEQARLSLSNLVAKEDLPAIKYLGELEGKFVQQRDFDPRILAVFLTSVLDIVARHVEPSKARVIADELENAAMTHLPELGR